MIRRLFTAASVLSLLLCLAACGSWLSGRSADYRAHWAHNWTADSRCEMFLQSDRLILRFVQRSAITPISPSHKHFVPGWLEGLGIDAWEGTGDMVTAARIGNGTTTYAYQRVRGISVHLGLIILLTSAAPALWVLSRRSHPAGMCRHCGYDLRASTQRCPECGTPIPAKATA